MKPNTAKFWILFTLALVSAILVLPYALNLESSLLSNAQVPMALIIIASVIQSSIIFAVAVYLGGILSRKIGFGLPLLEAWINKKKIDYNKTLGISIISGLAVGLIIVILDKVVFTQVVPAANVPRWQGFLASFYGGIGEEILMRCFLLSLLIFIIVKVFKRKPNPAIIWSSIFFVSVAFGLGHLPATAAITAITASVVLRAIVLNGIGGMVFGWLYWKKGLESAIIAHFFADLVLHVILAI